LNLGYECDVLLSFESSLVFYNDGEKKLIVVLDGIGLDISTSFIANPFSPETFKLFFSYYKKRDTKIKKLFLEIKKKYKDYQKICLGYSFGGIMVNEHMDNDYMKGYIYSAPCNTDTNKNIISYKLDTDIFTHLFETYTNKNNIIIKKNVLYILKIFESDEAYFRYNHALEGIDESEIPDIIF